jgi:hypothetical protein
MKLLTGLVLLAGLFTSPLPAAPAEPTEPEIYLSIFLKLSASEQLEKQGDDAKALEGFEDCYTQFFNLHQQDPRWEGALIIKRLADCKAEVITLQRKITSPTSTRVAGTVTPGHLPPTDAAFSTNYPWKTGVPHEATPPIIYPWKRNIFAAVFWIGEGRSGSCPITQVSSAWDPHWQDNFGGVDDPNERNGYAPSNHAPMLNPFYVALPFNDLAYPDKAAKWLPVNWHQPPKDGKPVSACKDRWVEIKSAVGRTCYAQWEDVGPLRTDHAEYVFGNEPPGPGKTPGLNISPAVAQYLGWDGEDDNVVSWRFVEQVDVRPGVWLKYDELALLYQALHEQKSAR